MPGGAAMSLAKDVLELFVDGGAPSVVNVAERIEALEAKCALLAASLKKADAEAARVTAERDEARAAHDFRVRACTAAGAKFDELKAERDRLRAALEETRENVEAVTAVFGPEGPYMTSEGRAILAALRARAEVSS